MRLLIIEDSIRLRESLHEGLSRIGFVVDLAENGNDGLAMAQSISYDLIILDMMLPGLDGLTLLKMLRKRGNETHILILSAKGRLEHKVEGLQAGADDYLVKPFAFEELVARIRAMSRRAHGRKSNLLDFGEVVVDLTRQRILIHDEVIEFSPREYFLLEYLALDATKPVSRQELELHLYSDYESISSNVIDATVAGIRRKLAPYRCESLIQTRRGIGYEFTPLKHSS